MSGFWGSSESAFEGAVFECESYRREMNSRLFDFISSRSFSWVGSNSEASLSQGFFLDENFYEKYFSFSFYINNFYQIYLIFLNTLFNLFKNLLKS